MRSREHEQEQHRRRLSAARRASGLSRWLAPLEAARARSQAALDAVDAAVVELVECGPLRRAPLAPQVGDVQLCIIGLDDAEVDLAHVDDAQLDDAQLDDAELEAEVRAAQQLVGELAALEQEATGEAALAASVESATQAHDRALRGVEQAAAAATAAREDAAVAARRLTAAREAAAREPAARHVLDLAAARLAAAVDAAARVAEVVELSDRRDDARRQRDDARERWLDLREQRLLGVAAELAAALADGDPCPVCGSAEHPALAAVPARDGAPHPAPGLQAATDEERAGAEAEAADDLLRRCESELARARAQAEAAAAAAGGRSVDGARAERDAAAAELAAAGEAVAAEAAALGGQERADLALEAAGGRHDRAVERLLATGTELTRLEERLLALRRRLDAGRGEYETVGARRAHAARRALAATGLLDARRELRGATEQLAEVTGTARAAATDAGFSDLGSACEAALPETELAALERSCTTHAHEQAQVEEGLADPALTAAAAAPHADPRVTETAWQLAQADDEAAAAALDRCDTAYGGLTVIAGQLAAHLADTRPLHDRYRVESGLSRCLDGTGGDNALRMSLSSYVLAARLEQVAAAASERLLAMSGGRYSLEHSDGAERGRGRSGLALRVVDGWTGRGRDTASLSGGESFYTSLALALGLADVVAAEAGGATIETLFVDEGFGSLDDDTLGEVMDVLDGLRSGGRVVGLVSHVADLRDRIPARLEVVKTRAGSTLLQASA